MKIELPSSTTPGGKIILTVTDYNLTGLDKNPAGDPVKLCTKCGRSIPLIKFIVTQNFRFIDGVPFLCFDTAADECIDCYRPKTDFHLYLVTNAKSRKPHLQMRIWELRQADGQTVKLYDPDSKNKRRLTDRGLRLMDGSENKVNLQPQNRR